MRKRHSARANAILKAIRQNPDAFRCALGIPNQSRVRDSMLDWYKQQKVEAHKHMMEFKMNNKHQEIKGYRELSQQEIDLMNEGKALAEQCGVFIEKLADIESTDKRSVSLGKTNLQQGFMWAIRSVAKPTTF